MKPFEAPQRSVKINYFSLSLRPGLGREGLRNSTLKHS